MSKPQGVLAEAEAPAMSDAAKLSGRAASDKWIIARPAFDHNRDSSMQSPCATMKATKALHVTERHVARNAELLACRHRRHNVVLGCYV